MRTRILAATTVATAVISGIAFAQTPKAEEDHSAHHPAGSTAAANSSTPSAAPSPEAINQQMKAMQDMHQKMQAAKSPAERAKLMDEHMKLMQSGMAMMGRMGGGPGGVASSPIAIIDRSAPGGQRKVVGTFSSRGRESHGLWTNPENTLLYVAHEQDELPGTPNAGQTVCSAFDVSDPLRPTFIAQIPLGNLTLPSGALRNKKSINLVYVRVGEKGQTA